MSLQLKERVVSSKNPFVWEEDSYTREIYPVTHYINQAAHHLMLQTGEPWQRCYDFAVSVIKEKKWEGIRNPTVHYLERQENGDREPAQISLTGYIQAIIKNEEIMAPTMTTYIATKHKVSIWADFILANIAARKRAKKAKHEAEMRGDEVTAFFEGLTDRNTKLSNNAVSGAHASASTPLYNQTNHSTLTSNCRMTSGFGNANNEKLLSGNRHYFHPDIVINNIISITQNSRLDKWEKVIKKYNMRIPSVDEVMASILYSTDLYWKSPRHAAKIRTVVMTLTPLMRAAFLYTGDIYHVRKYNPEFVHKFLTDLSTKVESKEGDPIKDLHSFPEDYVILARQLCVKEIRGLGSDYAKLYKEKPELLGNFQTLLATTQHLKDAIVAYSDFIEVVFVSDNVPAAVPFFPTSIRRAALTSDTDSTIFTVQEWTHWYFGKHVFGDPALIIAATVIFLASQAIVHVLARMSINVGVDRKNMWLIAMKNEFYFSVYCPTEVAKHYYALQDVKEGNIKLVPEVELKGVHLKSSSAAKELNDMGKALMMRIMNTVRSGQLIDLHAELTMVAGVEREIMAALKRGDSRFCRRGNIQSLESYKNGPVKSNYLHHLFWKEVMAPKYGFHEEPPFAVFKLPGEHKKPSDTQAWLEEIDPVTAKRAREFMAKYKKEKMGAFQLPAAMVRNNGIPEEIMEAIDGRRLVADLTNIFYIVLKTIGYYGRTEKRQLMLVSDSY